MTQALKRIEKEFENKQVISNLKKIFNKSK